MALLTQDTKRIGQYYELSHIYAQIYIFGPLRETLQTLQNLALSVAKFTTSLQQSCLKPILFSSHCLPIRCFPAIITGVFVQSRINHYGRNKRSLRAPRQQGISKKASLPAYNHFFFLIELKIPQSIFPLDVSRCTHVNLALRSQAPLIKLKRLENIISIEKKPKLPSFIGLHNMLERNNQLP